MQGLRCLYPDDLPFPVNTQAAFQSFLKTVPCVRESNKAIQKKFPAQYICTPVPEEYFLPEEDTVPFCQAPESTIKSAGVAEPPESSDFPESLPMAV